MNLTSSLKNAIYSWFLGVHSIAISVVGKVGVESDLCRRFLGCLDDVAVLLLDVMLLMAQAVLLKFSISQSAI